MINNKYSWGVDGFCRQHITLKNSVIVIFCVIPGNSYFDCCDLLNSEVLTTCN